MSAEMIAPIAQLNRANPAFKTAEQFAVTARNELNAWSDTVRKSKLGTD